MLFQNIFPVSSGQNISVEKSTLSFNFTLLKVFLLLDVLKTMLDFWFDGFALYLS